MTKANWELAPEGAETWEVFGGTRPNFCKGGYFWDGEEWISRDVEGWTTLEHRPRIIAWEDMKDGMVVRCVDAKGGIYDLDEECEVGMDECGEFGPINNDGCASYEPHRYAFELVSEPERKTVKDAVEYYNGVWPGNDVIVFLPKGNDAAKWHNWNSCWSWSSGPAYQVCAREEFESEVNRLDPNNWDVLIDSSEDDGDEWALKEGAGRNLKGNFSQFTHVTTEGGVKCRVLCEHSDSVWVLTQDGRYETYYSSCLEPIKTTITKDQFGLLEKARQYFDIEPKDFAKFMNGYEVK